MADRFFPNNMPDFVDETTTDTDTAGAGAGDSSLLRLLCLPYPAAAQKLLQAALVLKYKVVRETWIRSGRRVSDFTLYTGALGTALLLFKSYQVTGDRADLSLCSEIVRSCELVSRGSKHVTFICGRAGVCALGAAAAKELGEEALLNQYLSSFGEIRMPAGVPNELLYGRAGYLWACSFINKHIGQGTVLATHMVAIAKEIIREGKRLSNKGSSPLMYEWHGKNYWGAAHGLTSIMHELMDVEHQLEPEERESIKGTLNYMIQNRFPGGNYPSSEGTEHDRLVHWCHGAPGVALTLTKAAQVFGEERFLHAAADAAEVVWNRGLLKRVGICHGVSGNAYVFLSLYRATGNREYLYRAKAFAGFLLDKANELIVNGTMHGGDRPYSLFEGQAGMAHLFFDMVDPSKSGFPAYEL